MKYLIAISFVLMASIAMTIGFASDDFILLEGAKRPALTSLTHPSPFKLAEFYRPISQDLYWRAMINLWGYKPGPYHLMNVLLMGVACYLIYLLFGKEIGVWVILLWILTPINLRVWQWLSCIADISMTVFALGALVLIKRDRPWAAALAFAAAMLCKESAIWLPVLVFIWLRQSRQQMIDVMCETFPCLTVAIIYFWGRLIFLDTPETGPYVMSIGWHSLVNLKQYSSDLVSSFGIVTGARGASPFMLIWLVLAYLGYKFPRILPGLAWTIMGIAMFLLIKDRSFAFYISFASIGLFWSVAMLLKRLSMPVQLAIAIYLTFTLGMYNYNAYQNQHTYKASIFPQKPSVNDVPDLKAIFGEDK